MNFQDARNKIQILYQSLGPLPNFSNALCTTVYSLCSSAIDYFSVLVKLQPFAYLVAFTVLYVLSDHLSMLFEWLDGLFFFTRQTLYFYFFRKENRLSFFILHSNLSSLSLPPILLSPLLSPHPHPINAVLASLADVWSQN